MGEQGRRGTTASYNHVERIMVLKASDHGGDERMACDGREDSTLVPNLDKGAFSQSRQARLGEAQDLRVLPV